MKLLFSATGFTLTGELEKYATNKLARLTRQVPRQLRPAASCALDFTLVQQPDVKFSTCALTLTMDGESFKAEETTQHMYAALDIAVVHLEQQLKDYAARHKPGLRGRLKRSLDGSDWQ